MPNSLKEYHLVDLLTGASSLADLHRWLEHVRGNSAWDISRQCPD